MTGLERVIDTLIRTGDYMVVSQDSTSAELIYVHDNPPHPRIRVSAEMPLDIVTAIGRLPLELRREES